MDKGKGVLLRVRAALVVRDRRGRQKSAVFSGGPGSPEKVVEALAEWISEERGVRPLISLNLGADLSAPAGRFGYTRYYIAGAKIDPGPELAEWISRRSGKDVRLIKANEAES